jgi:hypothetical protein
MVDSFLYGRKIPIRSNMSNNTSVTVNLGYTLNLGNFQSLRVDLGCTDFVREGEEKEAAMDRVYNFVEAQVIQKVSDAKKELDES